MPFREEKHPARFTPPIQTDEEALNYLPAYGVVRQAYTEFRAEGKTPDGAVQETLRLWREFQQDARPSGYGKTEEEKE